MEEKNGKSSFEDKGHIICPFCKAKKTSLKYPNTKKKISIICPFCKHKITIHTVLTHKSCVSYEDRKKEVFKNVKKKSEQKKGE